MQTQSHVSNETGKAMDLDEVEDKASFLRFLAKMRAELDGGAEDWANIDLPMFLEAIEAWTTDWRGSFDENPWQHAATILTMGTTYE